MSKLIMLSGLPASGKTTRAEEIVTQGNWYRLNRDLLRTMLHFDKFSGKNEDITVKSEVALAETLLKKGLNVVVDDTNLNPRNKEMWKNLAISCEATFEHEAIKTSAGECLIRNENREKRVPKSVINNMALQYELLDAPYFSLLISDLDGTLCDITHRLSFVKQDPKDWKSFFAGIKDDKLREDVNNQIVSKMNSGKALLPVFISARPDTYREETELWLRANKVYPHFTLIMRREGDKRPDTEVKKDMYETYLKHYPIDCIFDDRPSVIRMWKELGLNVIDVGQGIEF